MSAKVFKKYTLGYCPIGNGDSIDPFNQVFHNKQDISIKGMQGVDAVIFWGGTDIHPSYYKEKMHIRSQANKEYSSRDIFEWKAMNYCKIHKIPMIGVCRGAQLMTAFVGGKLIQHVTGHQGSHQIVTSDGELMTSTSSHHQMMYPFDVEHKMLAHTPVSLSSTYENGDHKQVLDMNIQVEPEVVYYPQVNGLAIQGHPEWAVDSRFATYCNEMVIDLLMNEEEVCV